MCSPSFISALNLLADLFPAGCSCFCHVSPNVALDESSIKEDQETGDEQMFSEVIMLLLLNLI